MSGAAEPPADPPADRPAPVRGAGVEAQLDTRTEAEVEAVIAAVRAAVAAPAGLLADLADQAVDRLAVVLRDRPPGTVAAVAVPVAVVGRLTAAPPPPGLLACAGATYLAFSALDDQIDGDPSAVWPGRSATEVVLGAQHLLLAARRAVSGESARLHDELVTAAVEGQLRTERPVTVTTTPAEVAATISARSGSMLAGSAAMAAVAADGTADEVAAARTFGHELGVARQHVNDLTELLGDATTDLRNRTATMAVALAVQTRPTERRAELVRLLGAAADDPELRARLLDELAPAVVEVGLLAQLHLGAARSAVSRVRRPGVVHDGADRLIESTAARLRSPRDRP